MRSDFQSFSIDLYPLNPINLFLFVNYLTKSWRISQPKVPIRYGAHGSPWFRTNKYNRTNLQSVTTLTSIPWTQKQQRTAGQSGVAVSEQPNLQSDEPDEQSVTGSCAHPSVLATTWSRWHSAGSCISQPAGMCPSTATIRSGLHIMQSPLI